LVLPEPL